MHTGDAADAEAAEVEEAFRGLEHEAAERLRHEGVGDDEAVLQRLVSMRYAGQWRSLVVPMGSGDHALDAAIEAFHEQHEREFAYRNDSAAVELYQLQLKAVGRTPKPNFQPAEIVDGGPGAPVERRQAYFDGAWHDTPVYERERLAAGTRFEGPAIVNQLDSTTVVPPSSEAEIDEWLNIRIHLKGADQ